MVDRGHRGPGAGFGRIVVIGLVLMALLAGCGRPAVQPAPPLPTATRLDSNTYELNAIPGQLLLGGQALFFTAADRPGEFGQHVYRLDLQTGAVRQVLANRFYLDGIVDSYRLGLAGQWLIYLEISPRDNGRSWTLAGHNLASGQVITIDQATGDEVGWPGPEVAADGDWVVWIRKEATRDGSRSLIHAHNLASGERKLLGTPLDASQETWGWPNLRDGRLVLERDPLNPDAPAASVALIDLETGATSTLSGPGPASEPCFDGRYVAWKAGTRYARGPLVIYDLESQKARTVDLEAEYPHSSSGLIVAWTEGIGLLRIDAATGRYTAMAADGEGHSSGREVSLDGARVAWVELGTSERAPARLRVAAIQTDLASRWTS